jgi:MFS family permease
MRSRVFYGWWIVLACSLSLSVSIGTLGIYSFSLFVKPLTQEFGWSHGEVSLAMTFTNLVVTAVSPVLGRLADRFGSRAVLLPSHLALGASLAAMYSLTASLWQFYGLYIALGLLGAGTSPLAYSRLVAKWFDRRRGIALGLTVAGVGLGSFVVPTAGQWVISLYGWRAAYMMMALATVVLPVPLLGLLLREDPTESDEPAHGHAPKVPELTTAQALRRGTFWLMAGVFACVATCASAAIAHMVPLLTDRGMPVQQAAFAVSLFGISALAGRILTGMLVDRYFAPHVTAGMFTAVAAGLGLLMSGVDVRLGYAAAVLVGIGLGAEVDVMPYLISRYFGFRCLGEIYGILFAAFTLGMAGGPYVMGRGFDLTRSYQPPLAGLVALMILAIAGAVALPRYGYGNGR